MVPYSRIKKGDKYVALYGSLPMRDFWYEWVVVRGVGNGVTQCESPSQHLVILEPDRLYVNAAHMAADIKYLCGGKRMAKQTMISECYEAIQDLL